MDYCAALFSFMQTKLDLRPVTYWSSLCTLLLWSITFCFPLEEAGEDLEDLYQPFSHLPRPTLTGE